MSITVFIADDHALIRDGLRALLEAQKDIMVIGEAANGREAVRAVAHLHPQIVLMDIAMPELNGIEAAQQIRKDCPAVKIIILSMYYSSEHISRALDNGINGYIVKESAGAEVIDAIRAVHGGNVYLSKKVSDKILVSRLEQKTGKDEKDMLSTLSPREREVLQLVVEGKTNAEIADILFLSPKTIDTYRSRLMQKLNIKDLFSLIKFACKHGLATLEQS